MSDYTKTTNFTAKDALTTGDPNKIVYGSEHDTEYSAIQTAVNSKLDAPAIGDPTQILTVNSGGTALEYVNRGGWEIVTAPTAITAVALYEVTITAGYDYRAEFYGFHPDVADGLVVQMYESGAYMATASSYDNSRVRGRSDSTVAGEAYSLATAAFLITAGDVKPAPPAATDRANMVCELLQPDHASIQTQCVGTTTFYDNSDSVHTYKIFHHNRVDAATATKFKVFWLTGNSFQANGYYAIYRRRNGN